MSDDSQFFDEEGNIRDVFGWSRAHETPEGIMWAVDLPEGDAPNSSWISAKSLLAVGRNTAACGMPIVRTPTSLAGRH